MSKQTTSRVHYFKGQFLRTSDFADEQAYHNGMRYRHNIAHHRWGIVAGLDLGLDEAGRPLLKPGMAIDGYGRELIVTQARPLPLNPFDLEESEILDVWLYYTQSSSQPVEPGYINCQADDNDSFYRWQETPQLWLENPKDEFTNRREPPLIDSDKFDFGPHLSLEDGDEIWPIFLGQISRDLSQTPTTYSVNGNNRPYVGAVAHSLETPSDETWIQLGPTRENDPRRFVIYKKKPKSKEEEETLRAISLEETEAGTQKWTLKGETAVANTLTIDKGALQFEAGIACSIEPQPWSIYGCHDDKNDDDDNKNDNDIEAIRLVLPDGKQGLNRIVFGTWSADDNAFKPILTLADDGQITINGNLHVEGKIIKGAEPSNLSVAAKRQLGAVFSGALNRVHIPLGGLNVLGGQPSLVQLDATTELVRNLEESSEFLTQFITSLSENVRNNLLAELRVNESI